MVVQIRVKDTFGQLLQSCQTEYTILAFVILRLIRLFFLLKRISWTLRLVANCKHIILI